MALSEEEQRRLRLLQLRAQAAQKAAEAQPERRALKDQPVIGNIYAGARGFASNLGLAVPADVAGQAVGERVRQVGDVLQGREPRPATELDVLVERARQEGRRVREEYPVSTLVGALAPIGGAFGVASKAARAGRGAGAAKTAGQMLGDFAKGAASGAGLGAAGAAAYNISEEGGENLGQDVAVGGALGGAVGGAVPPLAGLVRRLGGAVLRRFFPDRAAARLALQRSGLSPDEIDAAIRDFEAQTTRTPSIIEVGGPQLAADAQRIAIRSPRAKDVAETAEEAAAAERQTTLPEAIQRPRGERLAPGRLEARTSERFEREFDPIRATPVNVRDLDPISFERLDSAAQLVRTPIPGAANLKTNLAAQKDAMRAERAFQKAQDNLRRALSSGDEEKISAAQKAFRRAEKTFVNADAFARDNPVTLDDIDKARRYFNNLAEAPPDAPGQNVDAPDVRELRDAITEIGASVAPEYRKALERYGQRAQFTEAAFGPRSATREGKISPQGLAARAVSPKENPVAFADSIRRATRSEKRGAAAGSLERLAGLAESGPEGAARVSRIVATNSALQKNLRSVLGEKEANRIISLSKLEDAARRNFAIASRGQRMTQGELTADEISAISKAGFVTTSGGGAARAAFASEIADRLLVPQNAAERFTEMFFDPDRSAEAISAMRRMAQNDRRVIDAIRRAAAAAGLPIGQAMASESGTAVGDGNVPPQ